MWQVVVRGAGLLMGSATPALVPQPLHLSTPMLIRWLPDQGSNLGPAD